MAEPLLELVNVSKYYTGAQQVVMGLNSVSLRLDRGEFIAITGESGSGKSTLAHVLGGILPYESGELFLRGKPTSHYGGLDWEEWRRDNVSFISQTYGILPGATVLRNVMSALILSGMDKGKAKAAAADILHRVDLLELKNRRAARLSSGQKQRLSIARALAKPAPILIADEPTGNLDAENSKKVIDLLADAAKERLVILVTHDFDEAKDLATRRVVLQNGCIVSDTPLRPAEEAEPITAPETTPKKQRALSLYVAKLQCLSRPVWSTIMALFFSVTAFAVFAFLGMLISSLDDTPTRIYDNSVFRNGDPTRILVLNGAMQNLTEEDLAAIRTVPHVESVELWANIGDIQYAYREGIDYDLEYIEEIERDPATGRVIYHSFQTYFNLRDNAPFAKSVPYLQEGEDFLTEGRLPEHLYEVVSADPNHQIGDVIMVLVADANINNLKEHDHLEIRVQVVGRTDRGEGLYFHNDLGRMYRQAWAVTGEAASDHSFFYLPSNPLDIPPAPETTYDYQEDPDDPENFVSYANYRNEAPTVEKGQFRAISSPIIDKLKVVYNEAREPESFEPLSFRSDEPENGDYRRITLLPAVDEEYIETYLASMDIEEENSYLHDYSEFRISFMFNRYSGPMPRTVLLDYDAFDVLCWKHSDEAGITIEDYAFTDRVLEDLAELGYTGISLYRQGSVKQDPALEAERVQTIRLSILVLLALAVLQVVVLRIMFSAETESYKLLSNIGLTGRTAKQSVVIQTAFFTVLGELIAAMVIFLGIHGGVERIVRIQKYLSGPATLLLVVAHIALSALATIWIVQALGKQVYPLGSEKPDIALDEGEEAQAA